MGCPSVATEISCWIRGLIGAGTARHERDHFDSAQTSVESMKSVLWAAGQHRGRRRRRLAWNPLRETQVWRSLVPGDSRICAHHLGAQIGLCSAAPPFAGSDARHPARLHLRSASDRPLPETEVNWGPSIRTRPPHNCLSSLRGRKPRRSLPRDRRGEIVPRPVPVSRATPELEATSGVGRYSPVAKGLRVRQEHWVEIPVRAKREGLRAVARDFGVSHETVRSLVRAIAASERGSYPTANPLRV